MADDLNFEDFDNLDLEDDDLNLGDENLDLEDSNLETDDDLDLEDNDLSADEALDDDLDLEEDDLSADNDFDLEEDDLSADNDFDLEDSDLPTDEVLDDDQEIDNEADTDSEDTDLVDPEEMSLEGEDFDLIDPDEEESTDDQSLEDDLEEPLEDDFDLEEEDSIPEIEEISDTNSADELENELSDLEADEDKPGTEQLGVDLYNELSADEPENVILDESMEILDMEMGSQMITPLSGEDDKTDGNLLATDQDNANIPNDNMATSNVIKFNNPSEFDLTKTTHSTQQFKKPEVGETDFSSKISDQKQVLGNDLLFNLPHQLTVQVGSTHLKGAEISSLTYGSVIELDRNIGEPVDIVLGDVTIAKGEVVQINDEKLGVRITRINC